MKPFLTGSRVYGFPRTDSDIDMVVLLTQSEILELEKHASPDSVEMNWITHHYEGAPGLLCALRFGALNLLCVTDPAAYHVWKLGTDDLIRRKPVPKSVAIETFDKLRKTVYTTPTTVRRSFTDTAIALARAVLLEENVEAARALADEIMEHCQPAPAVVETPADMKIYVTCRECNGMGRITDTEYGPPHSFGCHICNGSGLVEKR